MLRRTLMLVLLALPALAADWVEYRTGPFHVFSNAGDRSARERLTHLEQLRFVLGTMLGKPELNTLWPIHLVLFSNQKEYGPHALPQPLMPGGSATLAAWTDDVPLPRDLLRGVTQTLLNDNSGRMPREIETALADLFSTLDVNATRVRIGAPLAAGELNGERLRTWVKLQMLATQPEYSGRMRTYINNLQNAGEEDQALRGHRHLAQDRRQVEVLEALDVAGDQAGRDRRLAARHEQVDAEAVLLVEVVGEVHRPLLREHVLLAERVH